MINGKLIAQQIIANYRNDLNSNSIHLKAIHVPVKCYCKTYF